MPVMPFEGLEVITMRDETVEAFGETVVREAEASACGNGCETLAACTHDDGTDEEEWDRWDQAEADFDPDYGWHDDYESRRAGDLWERAYWGD